MFDIFTPSNGIYCGINKPQFTQLEYLAKSSKITNIKLANIGLFGEASTGKTSAIKLIAKYLNYALIYINSSTVSKNNINSCIISKLLMCNEFTYKDSKTGHIISKLPTIILFDEAHKLSSDIQNILLTVLEEAGPFDSQHKDGTFLTNNISWVFATTDSSNLAYALRTRLFSITFDQYTVEDIQNIIKLKFQNFPDNCLERLAICSKLVPRIAIRLSEQYYNMYKNNICQQTLDIYTKDVLNMDEYGLDSIDKRILLYLYNNKRTSADSALLEIHKTNKKRYEDIGLANLSEFQYKQYNTAMFNIAILSSKVSPKSRQDISLGCRLLDLGDLETRLSFLERTGFVEKTPKGIILTAETN